MAINVDKMREAHAALIRARDLLDEANPDCVYMASVYNMRDALEDLDIDIARAESGDLEDD